MSAQLPPDHDGFAWLNLLVEDSDGVPRRVVAHGLTLQLDNDESVPVGLVANGHRQAYAPVLRKAP